MNVLGSDPGCRPADRMAPPRMVLRMGYPLPMPLTFPPFFHIACDNSISVEYAHQRFPFLVSIAWLHRLYFSARGTALARC